MATSLTVMGSVAAALQADSSLGGLMTMGPLDNPYTGAAAIGKALPLLVLVHNSEEVTQWTSETQYVEETNLDVHMWARTVAAIDQQIQLAVKAALNWNTILNISGATPVKIERGKYQLSSEEIRDTNGELVCMGSINYLIQVSRTAY